MENNDFTLKLLAIGLAVLTSFAAYNLYTAAHRQPIVNLDELSRIHNEVENNYQTAREIRADFFASLEDYRKRCEKAGGIAVNYGCIKKEVFINIE